MKAIFTCLCLFIVSALFSQASFKTAISTAANDDDNDIFKIIQLSDGSYAGVGTTDTGSANPSILVAKLNAAGLLTSSKIITNASTASDDAGVSIIATTDGGFAVSGTFDDLMTIIKMDADLNLVWQKGYTSSGYTSVGTRLVQTPDGGYMIAGALYDADDSSADYLIKTDAQGGVLYSKRYSGFGNYSINDIKATGDGNYALLAGYVGNFNFTDTSFLIKIQPDGDVIWSHYVNTDSLGNYSVTLLQASDGGFVTAGFMDHKLVYIDSSGDTPDTLAIPYPQTMMNKFSASGNLLWSKRLTAPNQPATLAYSVTEDKNGDYLFCGYYDDFDAVAQLTSGNGYASVLKLNSSGNLIWTKLLNRSSDDDDNISAFSSIEPTSDGGFVVSGSGYEPASRDSFFNYRGLVYKFDNNEQICGTDTSLGSLTDAGTGGTYNAPDTAVVTEAIDIASTTTSDVSSFDLCSILPVQLLSFTATLQNKNVSIAWKTTNETNTDHFTVERSGNGTRFTALQTLPAKGNGSNIQTYITNDFQPLPGTSYYRLKSVDKDGSFTYSNIVPVTVSANGSIVISPNPVQNDIHVFVQSAVASKATLSIADMTGKILLAQTTNVNMGTNLVTVPAASLSKGLYLLRVTSGNTTQSLKFVKE